MRIYIATKWEEQDRAKEVKAQLEALGHSITHPWWTYTQEGHETADDDLWGVLRADAVVFIAEKDLKYVGALIEVGCALGQNKPVFVLGDAPVTKTLFFKHGLVRHINSLEEVK